MKTSSIVAALTLLVFPMAAVAQEHGMSHDMKPAGATTAAPASDAAKAFEAANMKMHKDMTIEFTGNADVDFARGMIPHHQGAIDMAQVLLKFGKDPELRKLAEGIVKAQETEIAFMKSWLDKQPK